MVVELDADAIFCALEQQYRASKSEALRARSRYLSLIDDGSVDASARRRAYDAWQERDSRCKVLAHRLKALRRRIDG